jgi:hypothetical protein
VEKGMDLSEPLVYLGVKDPETSYALETLTKQGYTKISAHNFETKDEIVISKLKVGFPAFHIGLVRYGKRVLSQTKDKKSVYTDPSWKPKDLFPSLYTLGDEKDQVRRIFCLGKAFGLIKSKGENYQFEETDLGSTEEEVTQFLKSPKGSKPRNDLAKQIDKEKNKEDAVSRLLDFKEKSDLDRIDEKIIDSTMDEINPLA